jgi:two-component sensor histidine kinase
VTWQVDRAAGRLRLRWREQGGPPVHQPPARRSFGSRMIEGTLRAQLGGEVERQWERDGLACDIALPLARVSVR